MNPKRLYERAVKLARQSKEANDALCEYELKKYGFEFANTDDDDIIDALNYGTLQLTYEEYCAKMEQYKSQKEETGEFGIVLLDQ